MRVARFAGLAHLAILIAGPMLACSSGSSLGSSDGGTEGGSDGAAPADGGDAASPVRCTPGSDVFCRCADRSEGTRMCLADGQSFAPCAPCP